MWFFKRRRERAIWKAAFRRRNFQRRMELDRDEEKRSHEEARKRLDTQTKKMGDKLCEFRTDPANGCLDCVHFEPGRILVWVDLYPSCGLVRSRRWYHTSPSCKLWRSTDR